MTLTPVFSGKGSPEERYLRNHSTYIAPDFKGALLMLWNILYGLGMNALILGAWGAGVW